MSKTESRQVLLLLSFGLAIFFYSLLGVILRPQVDLNLIDQFVRAQSIDKDRPDITIPNHSELLFTVGITGGIISIIAALIKGIRWLRSEVVKEVEAARNESTRHVEEVRKDLTYKVDVVTTGLHGEIKDTKTELQRDVVGLCGRLDVDKALNSQRLNYQDEQLKDLKRMGFDIKQQYESIDEKISRGVDVANETIKDVKAIRERIKSRDDVDNV